MALTNAQKQAQYRQRHLGTDGEKARVQLILDAAARAQLGSPAMSASCGQRVTRGGAR
jgi:hypothetical protein